MTVRKTEPTLLERYRADPIGVRAEVERQARIQRSAEMHAFFGGLLGAALRRAGRLAGKGARLAFG